MSVFRLTLGPGDDYCEFGILTVNGAGPWTLDNWGDETVHLKGRWVAGHSLGKSTRDWYYIDEGGSQRFFLSDFTPQYGLEPGKTGKGRWWIFALCVSSEHVSGFLCKTRTESNTNPSDSLSGEGRPIRTACNGSSWRDATTESGMTFWRNGFDARRISCCAESCFRFICGRESPSECTCL